MTLAKADRKPPAAVADAAGRGLDLREKFGRGGTAVGVKRAKQLSDRKPVTDADILAISSYFKRHRVDRDAKTHEWGNEDDPSAGYVAWLLWGGDVGERWADGLKVEVEGRK